jgi:hypothetical protein
VLSNPNIHKLDPFQPPSPWQSEKYLGIQDPDEVQQVKIGILQESPFLPLSDSVKRAIKQTERALKDMGYYVVPFFLTDEVWEQGRKYMNAIVANGFKGLN